MHTETSETKETSYSALDLHEYPLVESYSLNVDGDDGSSYYVRLVPSSMPGWTYDAYVHDYEADDTDAITYVHAVSIPGINDPTPQDYALAAVREVKS